MNKAIKFAAAVAAAILSFAACEKSEDNQVSMTVNVKMPADFPVSSPTFSGDVTITNTTMDKSYTTKAVNGVAKFSKVYQGVYDILVSDTMTADEFKTAAPELASGYDILLNGNASNIQVVKGDNANVAEIQLTWSVKSDLLLSRMYTNGTKNNAGSSVNYPKYWEIYNNTDGTIYLDGLCIAQAHGNSTSKTPCELYTKYQKEATYASRIARLEGTHGVTKNIPLEGGKSIVIAWNAHNFIVPEDTEGAKDKCTMNVDLSNADYEIESTAFFWNKFGDNANVPNLKAVYDCMPNAGFLQMIQAVYIFFATEEEIDGWETGTDATSYTTASQQNWKAKRVPNEIIIDAVETAKTGVAQQKRIPDALDAKPVESLQNMGIIFNRKIQYIAADGRKVLQDTNNSSNDFVAVGSSDPDNYDGSHLVIKNYDAPEIQPGYKNAK